MFRTCMVSTVLLNQPLPQPHPPPTLLHYSTSNFDRGSYMTGAHHQNKEKKRSLRLVSFDIRIFIQ